MTAGLRASSGPLLSGYDAVLVDLDGVVYVGPTAVPGAREAIAATRAAGLRVAFITNNASRTPAAVVAHLMELGIPAEPADVVTAAQAAAALLADRLPAGSAVLVTGAPALLQAVAEAGFRPVGSADDLPAAVVSGYDNSLDYGRLAEATLAIRAGALWVAANLDATMPSPRGLLPGNGALVAAVAVATGGRPLSAGKPERALYDEAVRRTRAERPLVVGDRLDTDIAGAVAAGIDSLLVLSGVAQPEDMLTAPPRARPSFVAADLSGLLLSHPLPRVLDGVASCGGVSAALDGSTVRVRPAPGGTGPSATGVDGLRAACSVVWPAADAGRLPAELRLVGLSAPWTN